MVDRFSAQRVGSIGLPRAADRIRVDPGGRWLLVRPSQTDSAWVLDLATGDTVNITRTVATSFVNTQDDHNNLYPPPIQPTGWATDNSAVLLYDNWDVWKVPVNPASGRAVNLTGDGRRTQVRYNRLYSFDTPLAGRFGGPGGGIDLNKPLYFGTYGEWTKKEGLSRVDANKPGAQQLVFDTARFVLHLGDVVDGQRIAQYKVYQEIRERRGLAHSIDAWTYNPGNPGLLGVSGVVDADKFEAARTAALAESSASCSRPR